MKIGILTLASKDSGGIYQYTFSFVEAVKNYLNNKFHFVQITNEHFPKILEDCIVIKSLKSGLFLKLKRILHIKFGVKIGDLLGPYNQPRIKELDLIISPTINLLPFHMQKPYIVTIHDFQHEYYPDFFTLKERLSRKIVYQTGKKADLVVCESEFVKKDIMRFLGASENKIKVIPSPPPLYIKNIKFEENTIKRIIEKYKLPNKYIFYPAHFWYHKNHTKLVQAINLLKEKYKVDVPLIFIGGKKNNFRNIFNLIKDLKLEEQVRYLGYVPEEDIPYLYKLSTALVMPTLFESVSMPVWEAFHLGVPVVSSNVCALPKQIGDAGLLFDPFNVEDMAEKIFRIWTDENLRQELIQEGYDRVKNMTLDNYAKQWEGVIEEAMQIFNGLL